MNPTQAQALEALPPLPQAFEEREHLLGHIRLFTEGQMRAYARAALSSPSSTSSTVTWKEAIDAIESMDDYARMTIGVDPSGPRGVLYRFVEQTRCAPAPSAAEPVPPCPEPYRPDSYDLECKTQGEREHDQAKRNAEVAEWFAKYGAAPPAPQPTEAEIAKIAEKLRHRGLALVNTTAGYDVIDTPKATAQSALQAEAPVAEPVAPENDAQGIIVGSVLLCRYGLVQDFRARLRDFFGHITDDDAYIHDKDDIAKADRELPGLAPHSQMFVYEHPAPSAAEDAKDADRYRWLRDEASWDQGHRILSYRGAASDAAIDAAMAKEKQG